MSVQSIRRTTAVSTVAEELREALLSGMFAPGTPLPEREVAEFVGAEPGVARAALAELALDGLVVHSLHRGIEVPRITKDELHDIYAARRVYETAGLEAMVRRQPVDVSWLAAAAERMGEAAVADDGRALVEADMAFHLAIVAAAGSRWLTRAAQGAFMELRLVLSVADRAAADGPALVADHQYLVEVFAAGAIDDAIAALHEHLARGEELVRAAASVV
jgi:DNA-binding GntR family transcriptional regulator